MQLLWWPLTATHNWKRCMRERSALEPGASKVSRHASEGAPSAGLRQPPPNLTAIRPGLPSTGVHSATFSMVAASGDASGSSKSNLTITSYAPGEPGAGADDGLRIESIATGSNCGANMLNEARPSENL